MSFNEEAAGCLMLRIGKPNCLIAAVLLVGAAAGLLAALWVAIPEFTF